MTKSRLWVGVLLFGVLEGVGENLALFFVLLPERSCHEVLPQGQLPAVVTRSKQQTRCRGVTAGSGRGFTDFSCPHLESSGLQGRLSHTINYTDKQQDLLPGAVPLRRTWGDKRRNLVPGKAIGFCV